MDKLELQKLRDLSIESVAERLGLSVVRHKCLCPLHDDHHASMSFNLRNNTARCFVCQDKSMGTIDLVMRVLHLNFKEACRWLSDGRLSLTLPRREGTLNTSASCHSVFQPDRYIRFFEHPWLSDRAKEFLYDERKLDPRVVRWCRLTSWRDRNGTEWPQIPYYDMEGKLIGIQNRNLQAPSLCEKAGGEVSPRFRFPYGSQCSIYNLPVLKMLKPGEQLFITEGASDCWAMLSSGHKAIAIPSATLLSPKDKELLVKLTAPSSIITQPSSNIHMYPDRDLPGERLFLQLKEILPNLIHHQLPPDCKDYSDYYIKQNRPPTI